MSFGYCIMRILVTGGSFEYQLHLANTLSKKNEIMFSLPTLEMPTRLIETADMSEEDRHRSWRVSDSGQATGYLSSESSAVV